MKKLFTPLTKTVWFYLIFLLIGFNSCKKDFITTPLEEANKSKITINGISLETVNFKTFKQEVDFNKLGKLKTTFEKGSEFNTHIMLDASSQSNIELDLSSIKKLNAKGKTSYVFSIKSSFARAVSFSNLTVEQNVNKDSIKAFMTVYTPSINWIKAFHNDIKLPFEGKITFKKIALSEVTNYQQGVGSILATNSTSAFIQVCNSYTVYELVELPRNGTTVDDIHYLSQGESACPSWGTPQGARLEIQTRQVTECSTIADPNYDPSNPSSGGGTGDPTNPDTYGGSTTPTPPSDYNPCDNGGEQSTINSINGVQVLVAGDSPCESNPIPNLNRDTINNLNNLQANCIFDKLKSNALFQDLLASFQNNKNLNVTFQMGNIPYYNGHPVSGQTHHDPGTTNFTITIDNTLFGNAGAIAATNTFLHEAFHANLWISAQQWYPNSLPSNFQNMSLIEQIKYLDNRGGNGSIQHNYMANQINNIALALKEYTRVNYPNIYSTNPPHNSYLSMAYNGLQGTSCYTDFLNSLPGNTELEKKQFSEQLKISLYTENKCP